MFDVIKRSVNTNLNKPLDTLITEKSTETNGKIDSKASQTSVTSMDTKVGVTSDAAGTASAGTLFGKMNKLLADWTTARADKIDTIATDVTSLKTSVVNGKQAVVNAINGSLGYASGLTTNHTFSDYGWWIQNKIKPELTGTVNSGGTFKMYTTWSNGNTTSILQFNDSTPIHTILVNHFVVPVETRELDSGIYMVTNRNSLTGIVQNEFVSLIASGRGAYDLEIGLLYVKKKTTVSFNAGGYSSANYSIYNFIN